MAVFSDCSVVLDLKNVPFKEKKKLMNALLDNGGNLSYVVNQKCSFVVASSLENISSSRLRSAQKHQTPVVGVQYVWSCLEKRLLLPIQEHVLRPHSSDNAPEQAAGLKSRNEPQMSIHDERAEIGVKDGTYLGQLRLYKEYDDDIPEFFSHFQVAKYSILSTAQPNTWSVLELQSAKGHMGQKYRVVRSIVHEAEKSVVLDKQVHCCSSEDAVELYLMLSKELQAQGFSQTLTLPPWAESLTSHGLQQLLLEEKLNSSTISQEVGVFVELIWTEALGSLSSILTVPVTSLSLNDVSRVEGLLLQVQKTQCEDEVKGLLEEINTLLPLRIREPDSKNKLVSQKLDLCQLIRDILNMTEATPGNPCPSSLGKYRALRCGIEQVPPESPEFLSVCQLLQDRPAQIQQVLRVSRGTELHMFRNELGNVKPLLHSTASSSLVGILSRGLLLPRVGVEKHGIERTDIGNLGSGIYFSDSLHTSVKYSKPSVTNGCRLLLVCEVALGQCKDLHERDVTMTSAPEDYNSVHGVRRTQNTPSDFEDDEYVVYNTDQIRLKYVVQYFLSEDEVRDFQPYVDTTLEPLPMASSSPLLSTDDGLEVTKNSLEEVTAGLLDSNGQTLPLQAVHVRCKLMDLLSQVVIFQTYTNNSSVPIEAKYVFPLEETAAVCGFEAYINGKHVIGKVKEKEQARKEYKQAIEKGHGAYLMDQDAPDVFTISVGNLPPGATVLIKVTFITELVVRAGTIVFSLPGSVAPWQQSSALNQTTQTTVEKVCVNELQTEREFSLCMSIEMPYEIMDLECSHQIKIKRTDCKAVVGTLPDQTLSTDGFRLSFTLFQIHMPRMWVEKHPEKDTEACMLVFYPHFESSGFSLSAVSDVIIVLDTSESMRGDAMLNARRIALKVLNSLDRSLRVNIISFGSDYKEAFPSPNVLKEVFEEAKKFIMSSAAIGGSTDLWRPLRTLNLLPPTRGVRNVLLISDGHVHNQPETLQLVRDNVRHTRFFTCGLSVTANRYMLRALAQAGGGTYEFFDTKTKYAWSEKVNSQVRCMVSPGCSSVAVKWQQFNPTAPSPVQAPSQLHALFNDRHTLVYGFVPHCTQATLFGDLSGQEIETMVSTTELQKTKGTFLHKLTARAIIKDFEDGSLGSSEAEHEGKKAELKSYIIELSKEFSILSQFTSFVAVEERDQERPDSGFTDVPKIISEEDVDILSYMGWSEHKQESEGSDSEVNYECQSLWQQESAEESEESSLCSPVRFAENADYEKKTMTMAVDFSMECDDALPVQDTVLTEHICGDSIENDYTDIDGYTQDSSVPFLKQSRVPPTAQAIKESMPWAAHTLSIDATDKLSMSASNLKSASATIDSPSLLSNLFTSASPEIIKNRDMRIAYIPPILACCTGLEVEVDELPLSPKLGESSRRRRAARPRVLSSLYLQDSSPSSAAVDLSLPVENVEISSLCESFKETPSSSFSRKSARHSVMGGLGLPHPRPFKPCSTPPPPSLSVCGEAPAILQSPNFSYGFVAAPPPPQLSDVSFASAPPPHPPASGVFGFTAPPPAFGARFDSTAPPPPAFGVSDGIRTPLPPTFGVSFGSGAPPPPPAFGVCFGSAAPPAPAFGVSDGFRVSLASGVIHQSGAPGFFSAHGASYGTRALAPAPPPGVSSGFGALAPLVDGDATSSGLFVRGTDIGEEVWKPLQRKEKIKLKTKRSSVMSCSVSQQYKQPDRINWEELFNLQHQDGYWECTGTLSRFLGLDVDFFANVFLKEKGICSLGAKAHADILKLVATMLVLQLIRVMKMADGALLQSLFRLTDHPEPRPAYWDAVKKAVEWVCWADRQYPCVYSRLEFGWNWESCTRQLLGLDSLPPRSPLIPVLQRSTWLVM